MIFSRFGTAAIAAATAFVAPSLAQVNQTQSTFVAEDGQLAFGIIAPENSTDVYFTLRVHGRRAWGAVGLGHDTMEGSLILMIYESESRDNVTFSPRIAKGTYEPEVYEDMRWEVLNGTRLEPSYMTLSARCTAGCRNWTDGALDASSSKQKGIYALGPREGLRSNQLDAWLPMHREYGSFEIDLQRTNNSTGAPVLTNKSKMEGARLVGSDNYRREWKSTFHAVFMITAIVGLMPIGALMIQLGNWARLHAMNMTLAFIFMIIGAGLGFATSMNYQRSRQFRSPHQVLGIIILLFLFAQFALGFFHHKQYKQTQQPTKLARPHRWLGRTIMFLGLINAFLGFRFALNTFYNYVLAALIVGMCGLAVVLLFGKRWLKKKTGKGGDSSGPFEGGYPMAAHHAEPWRHQPGGNAAPQPGYGLPSYGNPPAYQGGGQIPMARMAPHKYQAGTSTREVGPAQAPRDMV